MGINISFSLVVYCPNILKLCLRKIKLLLQSLKNYCHDGYMFTVHYISSRGGSRQNHDIRTLLTIEPHPMTTPTKVMSVKLNRLQYIQGGIQ